MNGRTIRLAAMGTGYFSRFQYAAWKRMPEVELVGICNRTLARAQAFAADYDIPAAFDDLGDMLAATKPDLVDIVTPPQTHAEAIATAAAAGVGIVCQKPFCASLAEAREAVAAAERAGVMLVVHENFRFQPWHAAIRRELDRGRIGEAYQIAFRLRPGDGQGPDAYLDRQPYFRTMPRFLVRETAIHLVDVFRYLFGEVAAVTASLRRLNPAIAGEDAGLVLIDFRSGARGLIDANRLADHKAGDRRRAMGEMIVEGSAGTLTLDGDATISFRAFGSNAVETVDCDWRDVDFGGDCVYRFQRHVVDHLLRATPLVNSGRDYLENLAIEEAIYRSHEEARRVALAGAAQPS